MKPNHYYLFRLKDGTAHEGLFRFNVGGVLVFQSHKCREIAECPRLVIKDQIDWYVEVCEDTANLTACRYHDELALIAEKQAGEPKP